METSGELIFVICRSDVVRDHQVSPGSAGTCEYSVLTLRLFSTQIRRLTPALQLDRKSAKPWAVILTDSSIFIPGDESTRQGGFRRSEVMPSINNGSDATVQGTTTLHFSVMKDASRPLNGTHMYHVHPPPLLSIPV